MRRVNTTKCFFRSSANRSEAVHSKQIWMWLQSVLLRFWARSRTDASIALNRTVVPNKYFKTRFWGDVHLPCGGGL